MAKYVEIVGQGFVEFPDDMSKEEMTAALSKLPPPPSQETAAVSPTKPTPQQIERNVGSVMPAVEGTGGAAFGVYRRPSVKQPEAPQPAEAEAPKIGFKEIAADPGYFEIVKDYQKVSGQPAYKEGADKEEYVKDFMAQRRFADINTLFGAVPELSRLKNAPEEDKKKIAFGRELFERVPSALSKEGQPGLRPYWDVVKAIVTDPTTYAGPVVGKVVASSATKGITAGLTKGAISDISKKAITKGTIAGGATESVIGSQADITSQRIEQQTAAVLGKPVEELSAVQTGAVALLSGVLGAGGARSMMREQVAAKTGAMAAQIKKKTDKLAEALAKKGPVTPDTPTAPLTPVEKAIADPLRDNMDELHTEYMKTYGKQLLDQIDPMSVLTDSKVQEDYSRAAVRMALKVMEMDEAFQLKPNEQISTAINKVFANIEKIDDAALEAALHSSGMTTEQFAAMNKATVSAGARNMQQYSVAQRMWNKMKGIDPAFEKRMKELYGADDEIIGAGARFSQGVMKLERERKAWLTSGIDTTSRNTIGTNIGLTAKAAAQLLEGIVYTTGAALRDTIGGKGYARTNRTMSDSVQNAFDTFFYMSKNGLAAEVTDELLKHNPSLRNNVINAMQDVDTNDVSKIARWAQTLNVAVDGFYRRAAFTASVDKQLRDQGMDLYTDILAKNKQIPSAILKRGVDDALKATLSYVPKEKFGPSESIEQAFESGAAELVKFIETKPGFSLLVTFPRFMANSMALQYRYSPVGGIVGVGSDLLRARKLAEQGLTEKAAMVRREASTKFAQGAVGTAALAAAIDYRENNQDVPWNEMKTVDGNTIDSRLVFPIAPYLAVADLIVKHAKGLPFKSSEAMEAVLGMKVPAGTQATFIDQLVAMIDSERDMDSFAVNAGKVVGDIVGGFTQPFIVKNIYDYVDAVRNEGTKARDPNVIESEDGLGIFTEAATQRVQGKLPILKESLPEAVPRLREGDVYKEGEFFNRLIGFRQIATHTPAEKEVAKLGLDPYRLYGSSSGNREYDRAYIKKANELVLPRVEEVLQNKEYQSLEPLEKKRALTGVISQMSSLAREITMAELKGTDFEKVYEMRFNKLGADVRKIINDRYSKEHGGKTLEQAKDYMKLDEYEAGLANLQFATGGLVDQTNRLLQQ